MFSRNLPRPFLERLRVEFGPAAEDLINELYSTEPAPRTLRVLEEIDPREIRGLESIGVVPWCPTAQWFHRKREGDTQPIHFHPGYQAGAWHVQEASGLVLDFLLSKFRSSGLPMNLIMDACAAPGGKTLTLLEHLAPEGLLVASEPQQDRLETLLETVSRTGSSQVIVTNADATVWAEVPNLWDGILVDIPCSGEGMFRKNQDAIKDWSLGKCEACSQIQQPILASLIQSLRPGGWMIYCTCTFGFSENTAMIRPWITSGVMELMDLQIPDEWGFIPASAIDKDWPVKSSAWWALPGKVAGEGFFCAVMRKAQGKADSSYESAVALSHQSISSVEERTAFLKAHWPKQVKILRERLSLWSKEGVPSQDLAHALGRRRTSALQSQLDAEGFDWHEIPLEEPLVSWYLQGQPLQMGDLRDGWNLMTYQGLGLGWMHKNGVRVTNYFPKSRRIKR